MTEQNDFDRGSQGSQGSRPIPDPTVLTTEQLLREIGAVNDRMAAVANVCNKNTEALEALINEKLAGVSDHFALIERQRVEQKNDAKEAAAQQTDLSERAIAKSETVMSTQLEQLSTTFKTEVSSLVIRMDELRDRVGRIESIKTGATQTYAGMYALAGFILVVLTIAGVVLGVRH